MKPVPAAATAQHIWYTEDVQVFAAGPCDPSWVVPMGHDCSDDP
jgi:hypothetical protein